MRSPRSLAAFLVSALTIGPAPPHRPQPASLDELYSAYAAGDFDVVSRQIRNSGDCPEDPGTVKRAIAPWHEDWTRARAVFLLDLAITCADRDARSLAPLLSAGATFVIQRPTPAGSVSPDFSFEEEDFRARYMLRYVPDGVKRGGWHDIKVDVLQPRDASPYTIRARKGYYSQ